MVREVEIRSLSRIVQARETVVTLTLDVAGSASLPVATRIFLKKHVFNGRLAAGRSEDVRESLEATAARIRKYVELQLIPEAQGLFLAAGPDLWWLVETGVPMNNFLHVGRQPYVAPLLQARHRSPVAFVVRADRRRVLLDRTGFGHWGKTERFRVSGNEQDAERVLSQRAAMGGRWATPSSGVAASVRDRFRQSQEEATNATFRTAARRLAEWHAADPASVVVFFGDRRSGRAFEQHLPKSLSDRLIRPGPRPRSDAEFTRRVREVLEQWSRDRVDREVLQFHERRAGGVLASLGPRHVMEELRRERIRRVFLDPGQPVPGSKCETCGTRYADPRDRCGFCEGALVPVSLTQEVIAYSLGGSTPEITFVPSPAGWLKDIGGMAALLAGRGLRRSRA